MDHNVQNSKLLDGMHEGLLILSQSNKEVLFCNQPSHKLLKGALSYSEDQAECHSSIDMLMKPKVFYPMRKLLKDQDPQRSQEI